MHQYSTRVSESWHLNIEQSYDSSIEKSTVTEKESHRRTVSVTVDKMYVEEKSFAPSLLRKS
ncbi:MAG: hypothetical protein H0X31_07295 [Nostocaceae cyanobacterium]|nr:hypothetical protein [Nostocaceae cyanobacterium]